MRQAFGDEYVSSLIVSDDEPHSPPGFAVKRVDGTELDKTVGEYLELPSPLDRVTLPDGRTVSASITMREFVDLQIRPRRRSVTIADL